MSFCYPRTLRFHETDAAGVVYFAQVLTLCHEAYEAALGAAGFDLRHFFGGGDLAVPIVHASVDFRRPLYCGDRIEIQVTSQPQDPTRPERFELTYRLTPVGESPPLATALTRHVCIDTTDRRPRPLSAELQQWLITVEGPQN